MIGVLKRWSSTGIRGAWLGALIFAVFLIIGEPDHSTLPSIVGDRYCVILVGVFGAVAMGVCLIHPSLEARDWRRALLAGLRAPGVLVAGFTGTAMIGWLSSETRDWQWLDFVWLIIATNAGWVIGRLSCAVRGLNFKRQSSQPPTIQQFRTEPSSLLSWIFSDHPIQSAKEDLFNHSTVAESIARKILSVGISPEKSSIAIGQEISSGIVVGPLGIGKTSVCNLVQQQLNDLAPDRRVILLNLSAWEYAQSGALRRAIVRRLISGVGRVGSAWGLLVLPTAYTSMIGLSGGFWASLARLLSQELEPEALVRLIGERAGAVGVEVVIWIDDTERIGDDQKEVQSLLYLIRETQNIGFVIACVAPGGVVSDIDTHKIADFRHEFSINHEEILVIVGLFRNQCLSLINSRNLVRAGSPASAILSSLDLDSAQFKNRFFVASVANDLGRLIGTPRNLKSCLRSVWRSWAAFALAGEIDLDCLIIFSALVECGTGIVVDNRPASWSAVFSDPVAFSEIRDSLKSSERNCKTQIGQAIFEQISNIGKGRNADESIFAAECRLFHALVTADQENPQSFSSAFGEEYIRRAMTEGLGGGVPDQPALESLKRISRESVAAGGEDRAVRSLAVDLFAKYKEHGRIVLDGIEQIGDVALFRKIVDAIASVAVEKSVGRVWREDERYWEPMVDIARILRRRHSRDFSDGQLGVQWSLKALQERRINLAHEFLYWWGPRHDALHEYDWNSIAQGNLKAFVEGFEGYEAELADELKRGRRWILHWMVWMRWAKGFELSDVTLWRPIIPIVVAAAKYEPQAVGLAMSTLLTSGELARDGSLTLRDRDAFRQLCGEWLSEALEVIANIDISKLPDLHEDKMSDDANATERNRVRLAIETARDWLRESPSRP